MDKVDLFMQMVTYMTVSGKRVKNMVKASTKVLTFPLTMEIGKMMKNMDLELKKEKMGLNMKGKIYDKIGNSLKDINKEQASKPLMTNHIFKVNLTMICLLKEKEKDFYLMRRFMKENLKAQLCMEMGS